LTICLLDLNIWNYNEPWSARRNLIVELIREANADVVALQEIQCRSWLDDPGHQAAQIRARLPEFELIWHPAHYWAPGWGDNLGEKWEGLAILSRYPIVDQRFRQLTRRREDGASPWLRGVLGGLVRSPDGPFWLFSTHRSGKRSYAATEVLSFVDGTASGKPFVLTGDFNVTPDSVDIRFLTGQATIDGQRGKLVDAWAVARPGESGETVLSWKVRPGKRIDYVLISPDVSVIGIRLAGDRPDSEGVYPSDHLALVADLGLPESVT